MRIFLLACLISFGCLGQTDSISVKDIRAIYNSGAVFYNANGIDFTNQVFNYSFSEKNLKKVARKYKLKLKEMEVDPNLGVNNRVAQEVTPVSENLTHYSHYAFVETAEGTIQSLWFGYYEPLPNSLIYQIIDLITNKEVPEDSFDKLRLSNLNFAGREINLPNDCNWMNVNNMQCPYNGQMNWSLHNSLESAEKSNAFQLAGTRSKNGGKVISEEEVDVVFEGVETKAKRIIYDLNGVNTLLAGGENLTVYYVAAKVRDHYVSCVMSFWNNDNVQPSGLTPLLEEVMSLSPAED